MTAKRLASIQPFYVMELMARARDAEAAGRDLVHMEVGEPDFDTPEPIIAAAHTALDEQPTHYTLASGLPALREAISEQYLRVDGLHIAPQRIMVTPGASGALQLVLALLLDVGDELMLTDPGYPCNRHIVSLLGARASAIPVEAQDHYQPRAEQIDAAWNARTRALLLASPANPTGAVLSLNELKAYHQQIKRLGGRLIVDEIYHGLTYGGRAASALELGDDVFVLNSFSKYYGMTGWRIGWLVAPEDCMAALNRLAQNLFIAPSTPGQHAALAALHASTRPELERRRASFEERRDFLVPALREIGFKIHDQPMGAFYIYADASRFTDDSYSFSLELLEKAGVVVTPGIDFGMHHAGSHIRFAYTTGITRLKEGVRRLAAYLN